MKLFYLQICAFWRTVKRCAAPVLVVGLLTIALPATVQAATSTASSNKQKLNAVPLSPHGITYTEIRERSSLTWGLSGGFIMHRPFGNAVDTMQKALGISGLDGRFLPGLKIRGQLIPKPYLSFFADFRYIDYSAKSLDYLTFERSGGIEDFYGGVGLSYEYRWKWLGILGNLALGTGTWYYHLSQFDPGPTAPDFDEALTTYRNQLQTTTFERMLSAKYFSAEPQVGFRFWIKEMFAFETMFGWKALYIPQNSFRGETWNDRLSGSPSHNLSGLTTEVLFSYRYQRQ